MKRLLAAGLALSLCIGLTACQRGNEPPKTSDFTPAELALREPLYPDFPQYPEPPADGLADESFYEAQRVYQNEVEQLRGGGLDRALTDTLRDFTARSTPVVLGQKAGENAVYSPASLWLALGVLARCADGESRSQLLDALGVDRVEDLQKQVGLLWKNLYNNDGRSVLRLANSVWLNSSEKDACVQSTLDDLAEYYFAGTYATPMGTPEADSALTAWVDQQTGGLIKPLFQTSPEDLAVLMSALYYKAGWVDEFDPDRTTKDIFTGPGGAVEADFMHSRDEGDFLLGEGWRAARRENHLGAMTFVLPDEGVCPEELLARPDFLGSLDFQGADVRYGRIDWSMPKFDVECGLDLNDSLRELGVTAVLDPRKSDLSALTQLHAYLQRVSQLTRVKVDEKGVEAAVVTILQIPACAMEQPELYEMNLDRPFLFALEVSGVPLFVGVVNDVS